MEATNDICLYPCFPREFFMREKNLIKLSQLSKKYYGIVFDSL